MSSTCSASGIDLAMARACENIAAGEANGRAAARRARNRGAPSNSGPTSASKVDRSSSTTTQLPRYVLIEYGASSSGT